MGHKMQEPLPKTLFPFIWHFLKEHKMIVYMVVFLSIIAGFWGPIILVPLIFGLYDITIPKFALIFTCFSGGTSFLLWEYFMAATNNLKSVFVGTLMSFIVFMIFVIIKRLLSINTPAK